MSTDEEQLEAIRQWWKKYRVPVVTGLVVGALALGGTRGWMSYQENQRLSASAEYGQLQVELRSGNQDALLRRGEYLVDSYPRTPYAALAALALARVHVEQDELAAAADRLQWVVDHAKVPELAHVARLRLARVMAADGRAQQALTLLEGVDAGAFLASYEELKGDLYVETGQAGRARTAYRSALTELGFGAGAEIVQMKLDGLGAEG